MIHWHCKKISVIEEFVDIPWSKCDASHFPNHVFISCIPKYGDSAPKCVLKLIFLLIRACVHCIHMDIFNGFPYLWPHLKIYLLSVWSFFIKPFFPWATFISTIARHIINLKIFLCAWGNGFFESFNLHSSVALFWNFVFCIISYLQASWYT